MLGLMGIGDFASQIPSLRYASRGQNMSIFVPQHP